MWCGFFKGRFCFVDFCVEFFCYSICEIFRIKFGSNDVGLVCELFLVVYIRIGVGFFVFVVVGFFWVGGGFGRSLWFWG